MIAQTQCRWGHPGKAYYERRIDAGDSPAKARRALKRRIALAASDDDLDELIGFVAAEANHEPNRRRQHRLDAAFEVLNTAAQTLNGW